MIYQYYISYDSKKDEFWAFVDKDKDNSKSIPVYFIGDVDEIINLIKDKTMNHIDDAAGLERFLKKRLIIKEEDSVVLCKETIY